MVALAEGTQAPSFTLHTGDGTAYSLSQTLEKNALVLLAFLKVGCPACQLVFPYLERIHRSYPHTPIWGISQDDADATAAFAKMYGITFPILLDENLSSTVDYDLNIVPSLFLVGKDRSIRKTIVGFAKSDLENLSLQLAVASGSTAVPVFTQADEVPELKPGCESKRPA